MILDINFSGGMGVSYRGRLDLSALPADLLEKVQKKLSDKKLSRMANQEKNPFMSDSMIYEFQYQNSSRKYAVNESQTDDDMLDLMDSLRPYIEIMPKAGDPKK